MGSVTHSAQQQAIDSPVKQRRLGCGHRVLLTIKGIVQNRFDKQLVVTADQGIICHSGHIPDPADDRLIGKVILDRLDIRRTACADNGGDGYCGSFPGIIALLE